MCLRKISDTNVLEQSKQGGEKGSCQWIDAQSLTGPEDKEGVRKAEIVPERDVLMCSLDFQSKIGD